jgi:uroporphyrinogen decarboxylase
MNNIERMQNILRYQPVDRLPAVHFGYWSELIDEWIEQRHMSGNLSNARYDGSPECVELDKILGWDFDYQTMVGAVNSLYPGFEYKEIERTADGFIKYQNYNGIIEIKREGAAGIPGEADYLLKDRKAYEELYKPKLQFSKDRIDYAYFKGLNAVKRETPLGLHVGSVLGQIRDMLSLTGLSYMMCDDYELLAEIVDDYAELQYKCAEEILKTGAKFDFAHYWEDVCFKNGPLISPVLFRELCLKHYVKRNALLRSYGIDIISLDCDGVIGALLPVWFEGGVNTIFPIEIGVWGDQFEPSREKYGKRLLGVGAMDKTALRKDKAAVDEELKRIARLVKLGGYIPCPDHRLMPGTKWELVQYYAEEVKKIKPFA